MSVKLGNTSIAGTQVLYSTTGNNTDGAMTQSATTSALSTKSNDIDVVHKTGDETIGGVKTFNNAIHFKNSVFVDAAAGDEGGEIELAKAPNSSLTGNIKLDVYKNRVRIYGSASNNTVREIINADIEQNALFVPSSDKISSAISTAGINKSTNGYFKFGNGLIIQWGRSSTTDGYVSFPTPFSNACTAVIPTRISSGDAQSNIYENASTTRFRVKIYGGYSSSSYFYWIAVGY